MLRVSFINTYNSNSLYALTFRLLSASYTVSIHQRLSVLRINYLQMSSEGWICISSVTNLVWELIKKRCLQKLVLLFYVVCLYSSVFHDYSLHPLSHVHLHLWPCSCERIFNVFYMRKVFIDSPRCTSLGMDYVCLKNQQYHVTIWVLRPLKINGENIQKTVSNNWTSIKLAWVPIRGGLARMRVFDWLWARSMWAHKLVLTMWGL